MQPFKVYRWFFIVAVVLHITLLVIFIVVADRPKSFGHLQAQRGEVKIIKAVSVHEKTVQAQIDQVKLKERRIAQEKKRKAVEKQQAIQAAKRAKQKRMQKARAAKLAAQKKVAVLQQQKIAAAKKKAQAKAKLQATAQAKAKKIATIKRAKLQAAKLEKQQQQLEEKLLDQQLAREKQAMAQQAQALRLRGVVDEYKTKILQAIAQHWVLPNRVDSSLSCQLLVRLAPSGVVLQVTLLKSSGNAVLDRSAQVAVYKASPLPVPSDEKDFSAFRELRLTVRPEQLITG